MKRGWSFARLLGILGTLTLLIMACTDGEPTPRAREITVVVEPEAAKQLVPNPVPEPTKTLAPQPTARVAPTIEPTQISNPTPTHTPSPTATPRPTSTATPEPIKTLIPSPSPSLSPTQAPIPTTLESVEWDVLTMSIETSGEAVSQIYVSGQQDVEMVRFKVCATVEEVKVGRLILGSINGAGNIATVKLLGSGLDSDPSVPLIANGAEFTFASGKEIVVPAFGCRVLTGVVNVTPVGTTIAGQFVTLGALSVEGRGVTSGALLHGREEERIVHRDSVSGNANAGVDYQVGDVVFVWDSDDDEAFPAIVTAGVKAGEPIAGLGFSPAGNVVIASAADRVILFTNASVGYGNTMRYEEVEPVITLHPESPFSPPGMYVPAVDQVVAMFTLTAQGYRDLTFNGLTIEKGGNTSPHESVTTFSLWRDSVKLAEAESAETHVHFTFAEQILAAGASTVLTIKADTTRVEEGVPTGLTTTFAINIPSEPGPIGGIPRGGLSWDYTPLGPGTATYKTESDSYLIRGGVLEYYDVSKYN